MLLTLILIGTLLEAWRIYALKHEKWTDTSNVIITNFDAKHHHAKKEFQNFKCWRQERDCKFILLPDLK